jgi:hypothetical protein
MILPVFIEIYEICSYYKQLFLDSMCYSHDDDQFVPKHIVKEELYYGQQGVLQNETHSPTVWPPPFYAMVLFYPITDVYGKTRSQSDSGLGYIFMKIFVS